LPNPHGITLNSSSLRWAAAERVGDGHRAPLGRRFSRAELRSGICFPYAEIPTEFSLPSTVAAMVSRLRAFRSVLQRMPVRWPYRTRRQPISIISGPWRGVIGARPAAAAGAHGKSYAGGQCAGIFFVEDTECRQANVRDLFLTQSYFVGHTGVPRQHIRCRSAGCRGCTARQRTRRPPKPVRLCALGSDLPFRLT
jgi:hypothetical protein